jgi:hypothetical protein
LQDNIFQGNSAMRFSAIVTLLIVSATAAWAQSNDFKSFPIKLGDTYQRVKEVYETPLEPEPYRSAVMTNGSHLRLKTKGVWFFFDREGKIYTIRFDAPFPATIGGIRIGDRFTKLQQVMGKPVKAAAPVGGIGQSRYVYYLDDVTTVIYMVSAEDEIETIFLNK